MKITKDYLKRIIKEEMKKIRYTRPEDYKNDPSWEPDVEVDDYDEEPESSGTNRGDAERFLDRLERKFPNLYNFIDSDHRDAFIKEAAKLQRSKGLQGRMNTSLVDGDIAEILDKIL